MIRVGNLASQFLCRIVGVEGFPQGLASPRVRCLALYFLPGETDMADGTPSPEKTFLVRVGIGVVLAFFAVPVGDSILARFENSHMGTRLGTLATSVSAPSPVQPAVGPGPHAVAGAIPTDPAGQQAYLAGAGPAVLKNQEKENRLWEQLALQRAHNQKTTVAVVTAQHRVIVAPDVTAKTAALQPAAEALFKLVDESPF